MAAGAAAESSDRVPDGVRFWQQDNGWYLAVGEQRQGPFLYRPTITDEWEQAAPMGDRGGPLVLRFTRFDAAGEQVTFRQDYHVDHAGQRRLLRTSLVEAPPSPEAYEGLEPPPPGTGAPTR